MPIKRPASFQTTYPVGEVTVEELIRILSACPAQAKVYGLNGYYIERVVHDFHGPTSQHEVWIEEEKNANNHRSKA